MKHLTMVKRRDRLSKQYESLDRERAAVWERYTRIIARMEPLKHELDTLDATIRSEEKTAEPLIRSFYALEISTRPGGMNVGLLYSHSKPEYLHRKLTRFCSRRAESSYMLMWYGATIGLWTFGQNRPHAFVDLHDLLVAQAPDGRAIRLNDKSALRSLRKEIEAAETHPGKGDPAMRLWRRYGRYNLQFDWPSIVARLPSLSGEELSRGETIEVDWDRKFGKIQTCMPEKISCGAMDVEAGERLPDPDIARFR